MPERSTMRIEKGIDSRKQLTCLGSCRTGMSSSSICFPRTSGYMTDGQRVQNDRPGATRLACNSAVKWLRDAFAPGHDHTDRECSGLQGVCTPTSQVPKRMACCAVQLQLYKDTPSLCLWMRSLSAHANERAGKRSVCDARVPRRQLVQRCTER